MNIVNPLPPNRIIHSCDVDFRKRLITKPVHLVQYDDGLPLLKYRYILTVVLMSYPTLQK